jgi:flagellar assembly factor FliW
MISFHTSRFGIIEVQEEKIIHFPEGIPGFRQIKRYILMDYKDTHLKWLQAVDDPDVAFIVVEPRLIKPDFSLSVDEHARSLLELEEDNDLAVLVIIRREGEQVMANFQCPLLFNSSAMKGVQVCLEGGS